MCLLVRKISLTFENLPFLDFIYRKFIHFAEVFKQSKRDRTTVAGYPTQYAFRILKCQLRFFITPLFPLDCAIHRELSTDFSVLAIISKTFTNGNHFPPEWGG